LTDPQENRGNQVTARELLDSGAKRLEAGLQDQPNTKAALLSTVGAVYDSLGQFQVAEPILDESLRLQAPGDDNSHVNTLLELGRARIGAGELSAAESPLQEALRLSQSQFGARSVQSGRVLWGLGMLRFAQDRLSESKDLFRHSLSLLEDANAPQSVISAVLDDLASVYVHEQQWALAKESYERALAIDQRELGDDHPRLAIDLNNLAIVAQNMGDLKQAESLFREAIDRNERAFGDTHPETSAAKENYGLLLQREARLTEAEPLLRQALAAKLSLYGPDHYKVGYAHVSLALLLHDKGDLAGSESEFRQALAVYDKSLPANHTYRASLLMHFARLLVDRGKSEQALPLSEQSIKIWTESSGESSSRTAQAHAIHAYVLEHLHRTREAADELDAAVPVLAKARAADDPVLLRAQLWLKAAHPGTVQTASTSTSHQPE
jgi:eukaryotic-like serine/threonine-protein kinase